MERDRKMTQTFRTGDIVTIGRFRTNHNYANDDYVGKLQLLQLLMKNMYD